MTETANLVSRRGLLVVTVLMLAVFGPYIEGGVRTEQAVVYLTAVTVVPLTLLLTRPTSHLAAFLLTWTAILSIAATGVIAPPPNFTGWARGSAVAGLDNLVLPVAVLLTVHGLRTWGADPKRLLRRVALLAVLLMSLSTVAAMAQFQGADWSLWWGGAVGDSTAMRAAHSGRFSGLINQPAEAGFLYGIALLCALYLWPNRRGRLLVAFSFIAVGGVMTVSKVFLFVALPLALWQMCREHHGRAGRFTAAVSLIAGVYVAVRAGFLPEWTGVDQMRQIVPNGIGSLVDSLTASRYGESSTLQPVVDAVMSGPVWFGFGAAGLTTAYDSGFVEVLVVAGVFGVALYCAALLVLLGAWRSMVRGSERTLMGFLLLLVVAASAGVPALTANRSATVIWLLLGNLLLLGADSVDRGVSEVPRAQRLSRRGEQPKGQTLSGRRTKDPD